MYDSILFSLLHDRIFFSFSFCGAFKPEGNTDSCFFLPRQHQIKAEWYNGVYEKVTSQHHYHHSPNTTSSHHYTLQPQPHSTGTIIVFLSYIRRCLLYLTTTIIVPKCHYMNKHHFIAFTTSLYSYFTIRVQYHNTVPHNLHCTTTTNITTTTITVLLATISTAPSTAHLQDHYHHHYYHNDLLS